MRTLILIARIIKKRRNSLLAYIAITAALTWMLVAVFPSFSGKAEQMTEAFSNYPEAMLKAMSIDMTSFLTSLEGFLAGENFSIMWPIILIVLVVSLAAAAVAGEIEKGTIEVLLAQPISRVKLFLAKYLAGLVVLLIFVFASAFSAVPFALLHGVEFNLHSYFTISILGSLFGFSIFGMAMLLSSVFSEGGKASSLTSGILVMMYALNIIAAFNENLNKIKYLSLFHYFDHNAAMLHNQIDTLSVLVFLAVGVIGILVGAAAFTKRDIAT